MNWKEHKKRLMKEPGFKAEYDALELEYKLARELIRLRLSKGLTQEQLAKKINTKQAGIARLESDLLARVKFAFRRQPPPRVGFSGDHIHRHYLDVQNLPFENDVSALDDSRAGAVVGNCVSHNIIVAANERDGLRAGSELKRVGEGVPQRGQRQSDSDNGENKNNRRNSFHGRWPLRVAYRRWLIADGDKR